MKDRHDLMPILRLAYSTQFLIALMAVFVLWSQVGGQSLELAARRRVVAASGPSFNHESIHRAVSFLQHGSRQGIGGDDGEELRPGEWWEITPVLRREELLRREDHGSVVVLLRPGYL